MAEAGDDDSSDDDDDNVDASPVWDTFLIIKDINYAKYRLETGTSS